MPPELLVLADDLTGALEAGAKLECPVRFEAGSAGDARCVVIDTETRHLSPDAAYARVFELLRAHGCPRVYKKTDSTLRGNIASELAALAAAYPDTAVDYIPAYPQMGRTVKAGRLYVDGVPLHETPFARDPLHPARTSVIADLLGGVSAIAVHDGESDADVAAAVRQSGALVCGPAGVAEHLARLLGIERRPVTLPRIRNCLVVNGSLHELSSRQVADAARREWRLAGPAEAAAALDESSWVILRLDDPRRNAATVRDILEQVDLDALAVFGGDTAYAIVAALGEQVIRPLAEVLPGIPISRLAGRYLVTKAGGFGPENVLSEVRQRLTP